MKKNIFNLLNHKTLTDFDAPILIQKGFGVFFPKIYSTVDTVLCSIKQCFLDKYDYSLDISSNVLHTLNNIDFFCDTAFENKDNIDLLNNNFQIIFSPLLEKNKLEQLLSKFKGTIYLRFFGNTEEYSYYTNYLKGHDNLFSNKLKFVFAFKEIFDFEQSKHSFFNSSNSLYIPCGIPDDFFNRYQNTYNKNNTINKKFVFVCSRINSCSYYTPVYNNFKNLLHDFPFIILGKKNENAVHMDERIKNNLSDDDYFKEMSQCIAMYYHGKEPRHLHYHPVEAVIIGMPVIFHDESIFSSFFKDSPGKCHSDADVIEKMNRLNNDDICFRDSIIEYQNKCIDFFKVKNNLHIFDFIA
jgi:hypothetical protein